MTTRSMVDRYARLQRQGPLHGPRLMHPCRTKRHTRQTRQATLGRPAKSKQPRTLARMRTIALCQPNDALLSFDYSLVCPACGERILVRQVAVVVMHQTWLRPRDWKLIMKMMSVKTHHQSRVKTLSRHTLGSMRASESVLDVLGVDEQSLIHIAVQG